MDGSTPPTKRFEMQQKFNSDPTIDVLLLTTRVGGLGLTLTGADTVSADSNRRLLPLDGFCLAGSSAVRKNTALYMLIHDGF